MKARLLLALLLNSSFSAYTLASTNNAATSTSILAIHFVDNKFQGDMMTNSDLRGLRLEAPPILSDHDFVAWDLTNHTFVITPAAAERVAQRCYQRELPFVLTCSGERVYLGFFSTMLSSSIKGVPVILTDAIKATNVPDDMRLSYGGAAIGTSNVTLVIKRSGFDNSDGGEDKRNDKRIVASVDRLFKAGN